MKQKVYIATYLLNEIKESESLREAMTIIMRKSIFPDIADMSGIYEAVKHGHFTLMPELKGLTKYPMACVTYSVSVPILEEEHASPQS